MLLKNEIKWRLKPLFTDTLLKFKVFVLPLAKNKNVIANTETDILIEGYPRSGNTFCVAAFSYSQKRNLKHIASHRHEIGHILLGIEKKLPVLVIIRSPEDAIASFIIRERVSPLFAIKYYIMFYESLIVYKENIVFVDFQTVIKDINSVIKAINTKFSTNFETFEIDNSSLNKIKEIVKNMEIEDSKKNGDGETIRETHLAIPSKKRELQKQQIIDHIDNSMPLKNLMIKAKKVYEEYSRKFIKK